MKQTGSKSLQSVTRFFLFFEIHYITEQGKAIYTLLKKIEDWKMFTFVYIIVKLKAY